MLTSKLYLIKEKIAKLFRGFFGNLTRQRDFLFEHFRYLPQKIEKEFVIPKSFYTNVTFSYFVVCVSMCLCVSQCRCKGAVLGTFGTVSITVLTQTSRYMIWKPRTLQRILGEYVLVIYEGLERLLRTVMNVLFYSIDYSANDE